MLLHVPDIFELFAAQVTSIHCVCVCKPVSPHVAAGSEPVTTDVTFITHFTRVYASVFAEVTPGTELLVTYLTFLRIYMSVSRLSPQLWRRNGPNRSFFFGGRVVLFLIYEQIDHK